MRLSYNRIAALLFATLSLLPIVSVALIIDALDGIGQVSRAVETEPSLGVLLVELGAIGVLTVVLPPYAWQTGHDRVASMEA